MIILSTRLQDAFLLGVLKYLILHPLVTGNSVFLQKKDQTYLREYVAKLTGPAGGLTGQDVTGQPKYYAMFGGATGVTDSTSGGLLLAPTPDTTYAFRIYYNSTTYQFSDRYLWDLSQQDTLLMAFYMAA